MHFCVNLVCQPAGHASAVLLRAGRVVEGMALAWARRFGSAGGPELNSGNEAEVAPRPEVADGPGAIRRPVGRRQSPGAIRREPDLARGPARLCEALGIARSHDGTDVADPASPLRVFAPPVAVSAAGISQGARVGISRAADVAWRFWITGEPAVSPYRAHTPRKRAVAKPVTGRARGNGTMHQ